MDFSKGVLFDPGYSKYTVSFSQNIDAAYGVLFTIKSPHQRKFKFQMIYPQLLRLLEHTVSFYLGCLLWAAYISKHFADEPKDIIGNDYINQKVNDEQILFEVNYAISYFDKLKKDCKYYLNKECKLPESWLNVLSVYKDFLVKNDYLVNAKTTSDIKLPEQIKDVSEKDLNLILDKIEEVVKTGELKNLFSVIDFILD